MLHGNGNVNLWNRAQLDAIKAGLHHTDDGHWAVVYEQALIEDSGVATETLFPVTVTQHHNGIAAQGCAVGRFQGSANHGEHAKD